MNLYLDLLGRRGKELILRFIGRWGKELILRFIGEAGEITYTQIYWGGGGNNLYSDVLGGGEFITFVPCPVFLVPF